MPVALRYLVPVAVYVTLLLGSSALQAGPRESAQAVVGLRVEVQSDARTAESLGREREGSGIVIDGSGLIVTIGYLIVEASGIEVLDAQGKAHQAEVVGYDHDSGLGLVRSLDRLDVAPAPIGSATSLQAGEPLLVLSRVGRLGGQAVILADRRPFAGYWEYFLDDALYATPAHAAFGGAPLVDRDGKLVGIGSLQIGDAAGAGIDSPGNMFIPIDLLPPIMADLLASGRRDGPASPWLGITALETPMGVVVARLADDSPAARAGLRPGDIILSVGDRRVRDLAGLWRSVRAEGPAGTVIPLAIRRPSGVERIGVTSSDRNEWLKWRTTL